MPKTVNNTRIALAYLQQDFKGKKTLPPSIEKQLYSLTVKHP